MIVQKILYILFFIKMIYSQKLTQRIDYYDGNYKDPTYLMGSCENINDNNIAIYINGDNKFNNHVYPNKNNLNKNSKVKMTEPEFNCFIDYVNQGESQVENNSKLGKVVKCELNKKINCPTIKNRCKKVYNGKWDSRSLCPDCLDHNQERKESYGNIGCCKNNGIITTGKDGISKCYVYQGGCGDDYRNCIGGSMTTSTATCCPNGSCKIWEGSCYKTCGTNSCGFPH